MYKKVCITNRHLVSGGFLRRLEQVLKTDADMLILREKDLPEEEYTKLAHEVLALCNAYEKPCILHSFVNAAKALSCRNIHLTMGDFRCLGVADKAFFQRIGVSTHTIAEAAEAAMGGASYITVSPIFPTECKKGIPGKGFDFLKEAVQAAAGIDVYALGGITDENAAACIRAGAAGVCQMSGYMLE